MFGCLFAWGLQVWLQIEGLIQIFTSSASLSFFLSLLDNYNVNCIFMFLIVLDGYVTRIMLQYDSTSSNNEITAIFRQDGASRKSSLSSSPQLLYCRCLKSPVNEAEQDSSDDHSVKNNAGEEEEVAMNDESDSVVTAISKVDDLTSKQDEDVPLEDVTENTTEPNSWHIKDLPEQTDGIKINDSSKSIDELMRQDGDVRKQQVVEDSDTSDHLDDLIRQQTEIIAR